jgi:UDP-galactopyranose mutase
VSQWLIVGAGLTGATLAERIATVRGDDVLVVDRRDHVAGNAYDYTNDDGIRVHKYGPHIFHTNSDRVWRYVNKFSGWRPYEHKVKAVLDGTELVVPFNFNSIEMVFPPGRASRYIEQLTRLVPRGQSIPVLTLMETDNADLRSLAAFVYENVFKNYTRKQWGLRPEELSPSVTARVPIRASRDDRYFQDSFQGIPAHGYTAMVSRMLDHPRIRVSLDTKYEDVAGDFPTSRTIYSGAIDEFFSRRLGALPYRSLNFRFETLNLEQRQSVAQLNFPNTQDYTRITEFKHLTGQSSSKTTVAYEFPTNYVPGENEPYYPIPRDETKALYARYRTLADATDGITFCGRLGNYRYYNMDQAIGAALVAFEKQIKNKEPV